MMENGRVHIEHVFQREYLFRTGTGEDVFKTTSQPFPVMGNTARISATVVNVDGTISTDRLRFRLEGSYDLKTWSIDGIDTADDRLDIINPSAPLQEKNRLPISLNYPYARLMVNLIAANGSQAVVNASVVFSSQE